MRRIALLACFLPLLAAAGCDGADPSNSGGSGGSGGTWHLTAVSIDLLVGIEEHVLAFSRRSGAAPERIEIWTLHGGRATHYRGYPLDEGLAVLSETTRSRKLELLCRAMLAFNRGDKAGWMRIFTGDGRAFDEDLLLWLGEQPPER